MLTSSLSCLSNVCAVAVEQHAKKKVQGLSPPPPRLIVCIFSIYKRCKNYVNHNVAALEVCTVQIQCSSSESCDCPPDRRLGAGSGRAPGTSPGDGTSSLTRKLESARTQARAQTGASAKGGFDQWATARVPMTPISESAPEACRFCPVDSDGRRADLDVLTT